MRIYKIVLISMAIFLTFSCGGVDTITDEEINSRIRSLEPSAALNTLIELDQKYPGNVSIKANIGALYIMAGQPDNAKSYLEPALELVDDSPKIHSELGKYLTYANLAVVKLNSGKFDETIELSKKAIEINPDDPVNASLTLAAGLYETGEFNSAGEIYARYWNGNREALNQRDLLLFSDNLTRAGRFADSLKVIDFSEKKYGFSPGIGTRQSVLLENMGLYAESIVAVFKDLDFARFNGNITEAGIIQNLQNLAAETVPAIPEENHKTVRSVIFALQFYTKGDFTQAARLSGQLSDEVDAPYLRFVNLAASFFQSPDFDSLNRFTQFEQIFSMHPGFYYFLWNGMKNGPGEYSFSNVRRVLEKVIELSPNTRWGKESRRELASFFSIDDWQNLLIGEEQERIANSIIGSAEVQRVSVLIDMLDMPENPYTDRSKNILVQLLSINAVRTYVSENMADFSIRQNEILSALLQN